MIAYNTSKVLQNAFAILSTFIQLPFIIKICLLSIFEWPFKTGFTVYAFRFVCMVHVFVSFGVVRGNKNILCFGPADD